MSLSAHSGRSNCRWSSGSQVQQNDRSFTLSHLEFNQKLVVSGNQKFV
jgi:hypothetical protein